MILPRLVFFALAAAALTPASHATASEAPNVSVTYEHPEKFTETREMHALAPTRLDDDYLARLSGYIRKRAGAKLAPGQQLQIVITDVDRAGSYEPWRGPNLSSVRIIRDIYPPRIDLNFRLTDASGAVIAQGQRTLRDIAFLYGQSGINQGSDSLVYEKNLIDRWLRKAPDHL